MDSCAETSVSTDFCIFCKNLIPSRSALPCSTLHAISETWNYCRSPSVRTMIGRQKAQPQRTSATALLSALMASASRSTILPSKPVTMLFFEASGGWTKPTSAQGYRQTSRRLLRAELRHQSIHLRLTGLVQCAAQRYLRFTQSEFLHLFQLGAHQPRGSRGP